MAFVENLDQFFETDDFAVPAVFTRNAVTVVTCDVIFDDPTQTVEVYDQALTELAPLLRAQSAEVATVRRGDLVEVNSDTYRVERLTHDGTGVATIYLARN